MREKLSKEVLPRQETTPDPEAPDERAVEDDLERRRQRLSKP
jgi:hypothetical protein